MTVDESYQIFVQSIKYYKANRVQFRYTRKHPLKSKRIVERIKKYNAKSI